VEVHEPEVRFVRNRSVKRKGLVLMMMPLWSKALRIKKLMLELCLGMLLW